MRFTVTEDDGGPIGPIATIVAHAFETWPGNAQAVLAWKKRRGFGAPRLYPRRTIPASRRRAQPSSQRTKRRGGRIAKSRAVAMRPSSRSSFG